MTRTLIANANLIDGTGADPRPSWAVLVGDHRIEAVGPTAEVRRQAAAGGAFEELDAARKTVMPGLIEGHVHLNFNQPRNSNEIDMKYPAVWIGMTALRHAGMLLEAGYTGAVSGGSQFAVDVWVKRAIRAGVGRGPRLLACGPEINTTGGAVDWHPSWQKIGGETLGIIADGPQEIVKAVRTVLKEGVDTVKIYTSGEGSHVADFHPQMYDCLQDRECMTLAEIEAAVDEVHRWGRPVIAHTRDATSVKHCVQAGVDVIMHATYIDDEGLEMIAKRPPRAVVPALMPPKQFIRAYHQGRIPKEFFEATRYQEDFEVGSRNAKKLHGLGLRVVPGGEYGLGPDMPHGANAMDLQLFVDDLGFTPMDAICAATRDAAHLMAMETEVGTLEPGRLADLLVVDGDPLRDITVLQDKTRIEIVMKDGAIQARRGQLLPL
jgi:imidazolonepropionase-like amidohydrolase